MTELCNLILNLNVDCVEFSSDSTTILACGLYQLIENERKGGVCLLNFDENPTLNSLNFIESSGVFGLKWIENSSKLITVTADGRINLLESKFARLSNVSNELLTEKMLLSVDLRCDSDNFVNYVASDNDGFLHQGTIDSQAGFRPASSWPAHHSSDAQVASEVWCCAFSGFNEEIIFSGADDCKWKLWDIRDFRSSKITNAYHKAGVTSVVPHPTKENCILTGGYDDFLCLWDLRSSKNPLHEINLGGGVWKVKFHPADPSKILCACMYNGWALVDYAEGESDSLSITEAVDVNGTLLYGIDWHPVDRNYIATCTFYDSTVRIFCLN